MFNYKKIVTSIFLFLIVCLSFITCKGSPNNTFSKAIIANHTIMREMYEGKIPLDDFTQAKTKIKMKYVHTSHGSQMIEGVQKYDEAIHNDSFDMPSLYRNKGHFFQMVTSDRDDGLYIYEPPQENINGSVSNIRDLFNSGQLSSNFNVFSIAWCGQLSYCSKAQVNKYLEEINKLENENPNIVFIYMTGHLDGTGKNGKLNRNNNIIREYCIANDKVLFDFADIESYDLDYETNNKNYLELQGDDACNYNQGNWGYQWQEANPNKWFDGQFAHTKPINGNQKTYAFWWLMCEIAKQKL